MVGFMDAWIRHSHSTTLAVIYFKQNLKVSPVDLFFVGKSS